ncbi:unnamed protein product, partial [Rotaria sp. Silwood1]
KDFIYKANQVTLTCLQLINAEHQNEMINIRFIRAVVESYIELGFEQNSSVSNSNDQITSPTLKIYKDYFEVSRWIDEELHRVQSYLHSSTSASLIKKT